jgi:hypothetical protein
MPAIEDVMSLEHESERLGVLWRSQGQTFLEEHAAELEADMKRLRDAYVAGLKPDAVVLQRRRKRWPMNVIDLREPDVAGMACGTEGHGDVVAVARCSRCHDAFCERCILQTEATHDQALCTECALIVGGVHHKRVRPLVAVGRAGRSGR